MWENNFDKKMHKSFNYTDCTCNKRAKVLVGMKLYPYTNSLLLIVLAVFLIQFLTSNIPGFAKLILIAITILIFLLYTSIYKDGKKMMLQANHSKPCSKRIGRLVALHAGMYSPYTIMKVKKGK